MIVFILVGCADAETEDTAKLSQSYSEKHGTILVSKPTFEIQNREDMNKNVAGVDPETGLYIVSNPESIEVYVNKNRMLPEDYAPNDLVEPDVLHLSPAGDDRRLMREE